MCSNPRMRHRVKYLYLPERVLWLLSFLLALPCAPVPSVVGDWSAKVVAKSQPVKLAAMEGLFQTQRRAPLHIGGIPDKATRQTEYTIAIPGGLSFLAYGDFNAEVKGLNDFPDAHIPPVAIVHVAFQIMVGIGTLMIVAALCGSSHAGTGCVGSVCGDAGDLLCDWNRHNCHPASACPTASSGESVWA